MEEEDDEDGTGVAVSHEALSVRLGTAGTAGMAALAAIHSSTSGSSAKCPPNDREMSPSSEVGFQNDVPFPHNSTFLNNFRA